MIYEEFAKLSPGEQSLYKWQTGEQGGFYKALWDAISRADTYNLRKLSFGFPEEVRAYVRFTSEERWWEATLKRVRGY